MAPNNTSQPAQCNPFINPRNKLKGIASLVGNLFHMTKESQILWKYKRPENSCCCCCKDCKKCKHLGRIFLIIERAVIMSALIAGFIWYVKLPYTYYEYDQGISSASAFVRGVSFNNLSANLTLENHRLLERVTWASLHEDGNWYLLDPADYMIPSHEQDAFFVMTNAIITPNQALGTCPEDIAYSNTCNSDEDCIEYVQAIRGNGVNTGKCINSHIDPARNTCEVFAWCPVENSRLPQRDTPLLQNAGRFTVLIKDHVVFPKFDFKVNNFDYINTSEAKINLTNCFNDGSGSDLCPRYKLETIVNNAHDSFTDMARKGGYISINISYDCDANKNPNDCKPTYAFYRLDDEHNSELAGTNFRNAYYYYENGQRRRDLINSYGIRFVIKVSALAYKSRQAEVIWNFGGLLSIFTTVTGMIEGFVAYMWCKQENHDNVKKEDQEEDNKGNKQAVTAVIDTNDIKLSPKPNDSEEPPT